MKRIWRAFFYSIDGMIAAWRGEPAFRQEVLLCIVMVPLACFIAPDIISLILMIGSLALVLALELINTAVEAAIDRTGLEHDALGKKAKDTASAAVLVSLVNVAFIWAVLLWP